MGFPFSSFRGFLMLKNIRKTTIKLGSYNFAAVLQLF